MKKICLALLVFFSLSLQAQLKSPSDFFPDYGDNVTFYNRVEDYFDYLTQNSDYIQHYKYGETDGGHNLNVYYISAPENLKALDDIRLTNLNSIGLSDDKPAQVNAKAIVWLSFNVHGNEMAGTESSMQVAYELINPDNAETKEWLKNTVVILDPCLNPDGFSRYANWLRDIAGANTHPGPIDREHMEPWPGGRVNHYDFDLNRDWAWQTQAETQQRMALYNQWMPMVHVDVHEMGYNEPYFFPPAAEPIHDFITQNQKDFHERVGENISKRFDAKGWGYYTREEFDLFYPSYGDTYPCFNGAIGMTFEQGGINAGRAVTMANGNTLTLKDRINHHTTAVLTTVETASMQKDRLIKNFRAYFKDSRETPKGKYRTYIVKNSGRNPQLAQLLQRNNIRFAYAEETKKLNGYHYQTATDENFTLEPNDLIVSADQPKAVLTQVLFEPVQHLSDSLTYDITSWVLPHAYGAESYALKNYLSVKTKQKVTYKGKLEYDNAYAFYVPWNGREAVKVLSLLHKNSIKVRAAQKAALFSGIKIQPGDLVILKSDNAQLNDFEGTMQVLLDDKPDYEVMESGFAVTGADLGSENYPLLKAPKVLLLSGRGISPNDFGQVWYYMDKVAEYPVSIVDMDNFNRIVFGEFNTLVLPDGGYDFNEAQLNTISNFINNGGKVIAMGGALSLFEDKPGYSLTRFASDADKELEKEEEENRELNDRFMDFDEAERRTISSSVPGAIVENLADSTHPLAYGLGNIYYSLKTNSAHYQLLRGAQNVIYIPEGYKSFGFVGSYLKKNLENTVTFAEEQKGDGEVIYMVDNPLFRGFWENGNLLFSNALFMVK